MPAPNNAASMALITAEYLAQRTKINEADDPPAIAALIALVSQAVEHYCGREFHYETRTDRVDGRGTPYLHLPHGPIDAVTSVSSIDAEGAATILDATSYVIEPEMSTLVRVGGEWSCGTRNYEVVRTCGYATSATNLPRDLQNAVASICKVEWHRMGLSTDLYDTVTNARGESKTSTRDEKAYAGWPQSALDVLDQYRILPEAA